MCVGKLSKRVLISDPTHSTQLHVGNLNSKTVKKGMLFTKISNKLVSDGVIFRAWERAVPFICVVLILVPS